MDTCDIYSLKGLLNKYQDYNVYIDVGSLRIRVAREEVICARAKALKGNRKFLPGRAGDKGYIEAWASEEDKIIVIEDCSYLDSL